MVMSKTHSKMTWVCLDYLSFLDERQSDRVRDPLAWCSAKLWVGMSSSRIWKKMYTSHEPFSFQHWGAWRAHQGDCRVLTFPHPVLIGIRGRSMSSCCVILTSPIGLATCPSVLGELGTPSLFGGWRTVSSHRSRLGTCHQVWNRQHGCLVRSLPRGQRQRQRQIYLVEQHITQEWYDGVSLYEAGFYFYRVHSWTHLRPRGQISETTWTSGGLLAFVDWSCWKCWPVFRWAISSSIKTSTSLVNGNGWLRNEYLLSVQGRSTCSATIPHYQVPKGSGPWIRHDSSLYPFFHGLLPKLVEYDHRGTMIVSGGFSRIVMRRYSTWRAANTEACFSDSMRSRVKSNLILTLLRLSFFISNKLTKATRFGCVGT